jgi:FXSXX-COOH protein
MNDFDGPGQVNAVDGWFRVDDIDSGLPDVTALTVDELRSLGETVLGRAVARLLGESPYPREDEYNTWNENM